jgi:hexosaminidase
VIPAPRSFTPGTGTLDPAGCPFEGPREIAELLAELGMPVFGRWSESADHGAEGYALRVSPEGLEVRGTLAGMRWAVQTLRWWVPGGPLPCMEIVDSPRYAWRGSLLDVARWCHPIEFLYRYVDLMALHKLNRLHLHLTDDQGWRFECKRYPRLHEVGGFRRRTMKGHYFDFQFDDVRHGGYYTQEQLKDLVAYARRRGVEIMPEIDLPGHTQAAVAAYPQLGNNPRREVEVSPQWGIHDIVLNTEDDTVKFFKAVLDEVVQVFPFEYVHLGGDEVRSSEWRSSPSAQARAAALGLSRVEDLLGWWIGELAAHLESRGRRTAVWDELLDANPPKGLLFFGWRNVTRAPAARRAGFEAVSCPHEHAYFDWAEGFREGEPTAINGFLPLRKAYSFEPGDVTGVQGQLWTEYLPTPELVEYRAFPRLSALAEVAWSTPRDFADFEARLPAHLKLLDAFGVNYRPLGPS